MEKITRTITSHEIFASVVTFDKDTRDLVRNDLPSKTIVGGKMDEKAAIKYIQKNTVGITSETPVVIRSIESHDNVYEISLDDFLKYATIVPEKESSDVASMYPDIPAPTTEVPSATSQS